MSTYVYSDHTVMDDFKFGGHFFSNPPFIYRCYLVGGLEHFYFSIQLGMSYAHLTFIFFRGVGIPPTSSISWNNKTHTNIWQLHIGNVIIPFDFHFIIISSSMVFSMVDNPTLNAYSPWYGGVNGRDFCDPWDDAIGNMSNGTIPISSHITLW